MKKIILLGGVITVVILWFVLSEVWLPRPSDKYIIEGKVHKLLAARTPQEWAKGLMDKRSLGKYDGMIFLFPDKKVRTFWNKNTYMDLEVIWMNDKKVIGRSHLPSIERSNKLIYVSSPGPSNRVVEIPSAR